MESLIAFKPYHGDSDVRGRGTRREEEILHRTSILIGVGDSLRAA